MITPETIVADISEALKTTDRVPDVNHNGKDYLSYRYRWNDTRCLLLVRAYEYIEVTIGHKSYYVHDDEVYKALKPLILKKAKKELGEILSEIAYRDDNMSVILRKDGIFSSCMMDVFMHEGRYSADYDHESGRIDLGRVPADFAPRFMGLVDRYFLPYVRQYREKK